MSKKWLITGGLGSVGKAITSRLLDRVERVAILDVRYPIDSDPRVEYRVGDISRGDEVNGICDRTDVVIHLAAKIPHTEKDDRLWEINVGGTENILAESLRAGVKRLVLASTFEFYGYPRPEDVPCTEECPKRMLDSAYCRSKLEAERLCLQHQTKGLEVVMLRMPMIFGRDYYHEPFLINLFKAALKGKTVWIPGDGKSRYPGVWVGDVAQAFILAGEKEGVSGQAFNIAADPEKIPPINTLAQEIIQAMGSSSKVKHIPKGIARPSMQFLSAIGRPLLIKEYVDMPFIDNVLDIGKARRMLGYKPEKGLVEAMLEAAEAWRGNISKVNDFIQKRSLFEV